MTKKEIARQISEEMGLTQLQTKDIVQRTFDAIIRTLVADGRIELRNFGVFEVKRRASRKARNPRTGETLITPARNVVTFKPGKEMEERVGSMVVEGNSQAAREVATDRPAPGRSPKASPSRRSGRRAVRDDRPRGRIATH
ncbi:MAG: HU family DNA-binding protein [Singulisphaera sp.]